MRDSAFHEVDTELLTKKELAKRLKVCQRTIEVLCNDSKIPRIVFGRNVRFKWRDVLSALDNSEAEADDQNPNREEIEDAS